MAGERSSRGCFRSPGSQHPRVELVILVTAYHFRLRSLRMNPPAVLQFNLSPTLGGAEVYTAFFSRALVARGWTTRVVVHSGSKFWNDLDFGSVPRIPFGGAKDAVPQPGDIVVIHAPHIGALESLQGQYVVGVAHQALYDRTRPEYYHRSDILLAVSNHVIATIKSQGLTRVYPVPLYGVADLNRGGKGEPLSAGVLFDPDARKPRDLILAAVTRSLQAVAAPREFERRDGLTLGIVSRIAPLKQFAALFTFLTPILLRHPHVNLEIFGTAVGFRALTELRRALAPLGSEFGSGDTNKTWSPLTERLTIYSQVFLSARHSDSTRLNPALWEHRYLRSQRRRFLKRCGTV